VSAGENFYKHSGFKYLYHLDAYRLKNYKELLVLGWKEIISKPENLILIEWPENVKKAKIKVALPKRREWKTEEKCRNILRKIYGVDFPSARPDFLKNPVSGKNLELDCYNEKLKLALEGKK